MNMMKLRVEFVRDDEAGTWAFHVPALHIVGGGDATREKAEKHCLDAIAFAFESVHDEGADAANVIEYNVQLTLAS